jgi:hypothetical protein
MPMRRSALRTAASALSTDEHLMIATIAMIVLRGNPYSVLGFH